jgi:hypothetical protein
VAVTCGFVNLAIERKNNRRSDGVHKCPRGETYLKYTINIALTTEFAIPAMGAMTGTDRPT